MLRGAYEEAQVAPRAARGRCPRRRVEQARDRRAPRRAGLQARRRARPRARRTSAACACSASACRAAMGGFVRRRAARGRASRRRTPSLPRCWSAAARPCDEDGREMLAVRLYSRLAYPYWFGRGGVATLWAHLRGMNLAERYPPTLELAQAYSEHAPVMTVLPWFSRGLDYADRSLAIRRDLGRRLGAGPVAALPRRRALRRVALRGVHRELRARPSRLLERTGDRWEMNTASLARRHLPLPPRRPPGAAVERAREVHRAGREIGDPQAAGITLGIWSKATGGARAGRPRRRRAGARRRRRPHPRGAGAGRGAAPDGGAAATAPAAAMLRREPAHGGAARLPPGVRGAARALAGDRPAPAAGGAARRSPGRAARSPPGGRGRRRRRAVFWARSYRNNLPHALRERALIMALTGSGSRAGRACSSAAPPRPSARAPPTSSRSPATPRRGWRPIATTRARAEALRAAELELETLRGELAADPRARRRAVARRPLRRRARLRPPDRRAPSPRRRWWRRRARRRWCCCAPSAPR